MAKLSTSIPEYDKRRVGERLTALREANEWQQKRFAKMIGAGMTPQKLNNYEKGRDLLPVHFAARVCDVSGTDFDYIYRGLLSGLPRDLAAKLSPALAGKKGRPTS
jgi:transcriptional regulator with XRE-family HTH domain